MGAIKTYYILLILILLVCTSCQQNDIEVKIDRPVTSLGVVEEVNETPVVEQNKTESVNNWPEMYFNHSQLPSSTYNEYVRDRKFSTLMDIDELTYENCEQVIEDIEDKIIETIDDIEDAEEDLAESVDYLEDAYAQYDRADATNDTDKMDDARYNIRYGKEYVDEDKYELLDLERELQELDYTLEIVEEECERIEINSN